MTRRQAVIEALEHREHETIPFHMDFTKQALDQLIAYTKDEEIEEKIGSCINIIQYWGWPTQLPGKPGFFRMNSVLSGTATARSRTLALWKSRR